MELLNLKVEIFEEIASRYVPETVLSTYLTKQMSTYEDLWCLRKAFTRQMAATSFLSYILSVGHRQPQKLNISLKTGNVWFAEPVPTIAASSVLLTNSEPVPFRLTPNIQNFITPAGLEGLFSSALLSIGRSLCDAEVNNLLLNMECLLTLSKISLSWKTICVCT